MIANAVSASAISYACNLCTETFSRPVWHCPSCRHHWADEDDQCGNCNHKRTKRDKLTKPLGAVKTFTEDTSEKTGRSQRVIQEDVQIAKDLDEETKEAVRGTKLENSKTDLLELAREKDAEKRRELVDEVKSGKAKSVREAKSKLAPPNPEAWWSCPSCNQDFNAESAKASGWVKRGRCGACEDWADGGLEDDSSDEPSQAPIVVHPEPSTRVEQIAAAVRALTKDEVIVLWSLTRVRFEEVGVAEAR